ncbi:FMN-binding negative transcriptional regulator [Phyllobacterium sp. 628]|uniref:FMN-binding negative transcriptional regulator n=1 Tax=Phyllobacterium sp. 628 TaxID=2718938 RepID=UPI001662781F|nr:FMN-binding negative transcriptional regulator [Phyllobacterium sp. 628]QND52306.1 FMN-binding negative transcriptional regulator [Phyllobacterium sp. 628]
MYRPPAFREDRLDVMHDLIRKHPLAMLVTNGEQGLMANLIPFEIDAEASTHGTLRAHLAKANEQVAALQAGAEALIIFQGPNTYVTPSWYATKREHGKVVPTWNYVVVQAWGVPQIHDDPEWLRRQIDSLTRKQESNRDQPWAVEDAPEPFIAGQVKGIIGVEIPITRIEGKWKVSQNRSEADRSGVAGGLRSEGPEAEAMAQIVDERGNAAGR